MAESDDMAALAIIGGIIGAIVGGPAGIVIGGIIGAVIGKASSAKGR